MHGEKSTINYGFLGQTYPLLSAHVAQDTPPFWPPLFFHIL